MAITFEVKGKPLEIKFDYRTMFKANKVLGTTDDNGKKNEDGASSLFSRILEQDDSAVFDLIKLVHTGKALSEEDLFIAVESYMEDTGKEDSEAYDALFNDVKEEMLNSGFFVKKLNKQIQNMEKGKEMLSKKEDDQTQMQVKALGDMIDSMKKEISSHNAQDQD